MVDKNVTAGLPESLPVFPFGAVDQNLQIWCLWQRYKPKYLQGARINGSYSHNNAPEIIKKTFQIELFRNSVFTRSLFWDFA